MGKSMQAKIQAKFQAGMDKRAGDPTMTASVRPELPPRVITACATAPSYGPGFKQNGEHDPS